MRTPIAILLIIVSIALAVAAILIGGALGAACIVLGVFLATHVGVKTTEVRQ